MPEKSSAMPIGERYLRFARGLPAHPERAFGNQTERWRFTEKEGDEVFTATRRTRDRVWQVIFELDDGSTFLRHGEGDKGNLMCISPMTPRGSLMIRDSGVMNIDGENFQGNEVLFYEPDGELDVVAAEFNRMKRGNPGSIAGTMPRYLMDRALRFARENDFIAERTVPCQTAHMDGEKFRLGFSIFPKGTHGDIHLERKAREGGAYGYNHHKVPMSLEHPRDVVDCLRKKMNFAAGEALM
jgi:hypothetical protein